MEEKNVVNEELTTPQPSEGETPVEVEKEETTPSAPAGSKTDPNLLLASLQEEREKRRLEEEKGKQLEEEIEVLKSSAPADTEYEFSEDGKVLEEKLKNIQVKLEKLEEDKSLDQLFNKYPILKEKSDDFKSYRSSEHPRAKLESVAKLYLAENGLLEPERKGLEKPTGGDKTPSHSGMTADDVATLRKTNFKKYQELLMNGQINIT